MGGMDENEKLRRGVLPMDPMEDTTEYEGLRPMLIPGEHASQLDDVSAELYAATSRFPPFNSAHEGYAVLDEERDELWQHVKVKQGQRDIAKMRKEAIQVAAMAIRFVVDVCDGGRGQK